MPSADEEPEAPEITIDAQDASGKMGSAEDMAKIILDYLGKNGYLKSKP
jgi:hypothetical protein